ncbi:DUF4062 domain-containing protein [Lachnospiraceae bacterium 48-21]
MEKIYKVFVSSTYNDLKDARWKVNQALLESDCIPAGMELFHAADKDQWTLIKNVISSCDFYIVIIADRYGSVHPETKISYTQMEYEYAYKIGIPIFAFFYENSVKNQTNEEDEESYIKLNEFKKRILNERHVKFSINPYDLSSSVKTSIYKAIKDNPPGGWVRFKDIVDNYISNSEMLKQINELKTIILSNYKNIPKNEQRKKNINSSELLNQLNELKNILKSNDTKSDFSTEKTKKTQIYHDDSAYKCIYKICSKKITFSLNSMHVSALKEITNIIFSAGTTALSEFFCKPIKADYSHLEICKNFTDIQKITNNHTKYCLFSDFYSDEINDKIRGKIYLNFSLNLIEEIRKFFDTTDPYFSAYGYNYFKSAIYELCSIFVGASLTGLSTILSLKIQMSASIINTNINKIDLFKNDNTILISKFSNDKNEPNLFDAYLILEPTAIKSLLELAFGEPIM